MYEQDTRHLRAKYKEFDFILAGDINARMGRPRDSTERMYLGRFGEDFRNPDGARALQYLIKQDMVCLNGREFTPTVEFTSHSPADPTNTSVIDVICVSRGMMRSAYTAGVAVLPPI